MHYVDFGFDFDSFSVDIHWGYENPHLDLFRKSCNLKILKILLKPLTIVYITQKETKETPGTFMHQNEPQELGDILNN